MEGTAVLRVMVETLAAMPSLVQMGILGVVGGAVGGLISLALPSKSAKAVVLTICLVLPITLGSVVIDRMNVAYGDAAALREVDQNPLFQTIVKYHPEARDAIRELVRHTMASAPAARRSAAVQAASADFVGKYLGPAFLNASDAAVHAFLVSSAAMLQRLASSPADCVNLYLGLPVSGAVLEDEWIQELAQRKADIIETAESSPSPPVRDPNIVRVAQSVHAAFVAQGLPLEDLRKVGTERQLPAAEGCRVATSFISALASMNDADASHDYKNLLLMGNGGGR